MNPSDSPTTEATTPAPAPYPRVAAESSGKAVASLICGILSFFLSLLAGVPAVILGILALGDIRRSQGRRSGQGLAIAGLVMGSIGCVLPLLLALLLPAIQASRESARRNVSMTNMRQIGLALQEYVDVHGHLLRAGTEQPPIAVSPDAMKKQGLGLSWRVHLLPYLDRQDLFDQFHLDEPWNSAHNRSLASQMPGVYQSPNWPVGPEHTVYLAVVDGRGASKPQTVRARLAGNSERRDRRWHVEHNFRRGGLRQACGLDATKGLGISTARPPCRVGSG